MNTSRIGVASLLTVCFAVLFCAAARAEDVTTLRITDKVLNENCKPFGINVGGDSPWSPILKARNAVNFEGTAYRRCVMTGPTCSAKECLLVDATEKVKQQQACEHVGVDTDKITTFMLDEAWVKILTKDSSRCHFTVLSGRNKDVKGKILNVERTIKYDRWNIKRLEDMYVITIDRKLPPLERRAGLRLEALYLDEGQLIGSQIHFQGDKVRVSHDVPPTSFGNSSMLLKDGGSVMLRVATPPRGVPVVDVQGSLWAKGAAGAAELSLLNYADRTVLQKLALTGEWKKYDFKHSLKKPDPKVEFRFTLAASGDVLIDDIATTMGGDTNPSPFRDSFVKIMKDFRPGIIRTLQMGGGDVESFISSRNKGHAQTHMLGAQLGPNAHHGQYPFAPRDYFALCEYLDCEAWLCLPGTVTKEGVAKYVEYLGAPADVGYGKLRAEQGHPKPWTESLKGIHIEFGNEIWNSARHYNGCGYNGPDFWHDLIEAGKRSPYYKKTIIFNVGGRHSPGMHNPPVPVKAPNADRYSWAPYILHKMSRQDEKQLGSDENMVKWAFTRAIDDATNKGGGRGQMFSAFRLVKGRAPLSIYEINHHLMYFNAKDPTSGSVHARNTIMETLAGGVNVANAMLMHLKYLGAFDQCFFGYGAQKPDFPVYMWSTHYVDPDGTVRYNPHFLALSTINKSIRAQLLETVHEGDVPVFSGFTMEKFEKVDGLPVLWSYAFRKDRERSLIIVSLDLAQERTVKIVFDGAPAGGAVRRVVTAAGFTNHNRIKADVRVVEDKLPAFKSGYSLTVPACSLLALTWTE
jgi:hypothetical protein